LGELGVIPGVYGRLRNLIKVNKRYEQAIEAAASGWLDAVVVKNLDSAFTCTETLRRMKLGRAKMILTEVAEKRRSIELPEEKGVNGVASFFVNCAKQYEPAIHFVFGDTLVVSNDKMAMVLSNEGYRTVTVNGDLYEAGGAIESGYYRAPIDFSTIIPSEVAIKSLDEAVGALQQHLSRRNGDITSFEEDIEKTRVQIARLSEAIDTLDREITRVRRSSGRSKTNINRLGKHMARFEKEIENRKAQMWIQKAERNSIQKEMWKLKKKLARLRQKADPTQRLNGNWKKLERM